MKKFIFILITLIITGCATTANYEAVLQTWVGSSEMKLVSSWGPPTGTYALPDGGKMLTWAKSSGPQAVSGYNAFTKTVTTNTYTNWCNTTFTINTSGTVTNWQHEGNACKSQPPEQTTTNVSAQVDQKSDQKAKIKDFNDQMKTMCEKTEYKSILEKTSCNAQEVSFTQMADEKKINKDQKPVFLKFHTEATTISKQMRDYSRSVAVSESDRRLCDLSDSIASIRDSLSLDLYAGKITWGEFNKGRKDLVEKYLAEYKKLYQAQK